MSRLHQNFMTISSLAQVSWARSLQDIRGYQDRQRCGRCQGLVHWQTWAWHRQRMRLVWLLYRHCWQPKHQLLPESPPHALHGQNPILIKKWTSQAVLKGDLLIATDTSAGAIINPRDLCDVGQKHIATGSLRNSPAWWIQDKWIQHTAVYTKLALVCFHLVKFSDTPFVWSGRIWQVHCCGGLKQWV